MCLVRHVVLTPSTLGSGSEAQSMGTHRPVAIWLIARYAPAYCLTYDCFFSLPLSSLSFAQCQAS
jgi:hypothetical protein